MTNVRRVCFVLVAGLLLAASLSATPAEIALPDGTVIYKTDNRVIGERVLPAAGTYKIHCWEEQLPSGELRSFYAYSRTTKHGSELVGRVRATTHVVRLLDFQFDPLVDGPPSFDVPLKAAQNNLHLVQLEATPLPEMTQAIADTGAKILRFLADHTFLVKADAETLVRVQSLAFVRWIGPYHPLYRVEPVLREALEGHGPPLARQRYSLMVGERGAASQEALAAKIRDLGGIVELVEPGGWRVEATLSHGQLKQIIEVDEVQFVDRWGGPGELDMNIVRQVGGGDYVESVGGFTGQGVRGEIFDTELRTTHQEWNHTPLIHSVSTSCSSLHGTSCYSNNFAQGVDPNARGMIPDGQGIFYCYSESTQFGGSKSRYDINAELIDPAGPYRAVFQTASVGSSRTRSYTTISAETDDYLFQHQILSTQSQSNAGNQDSRPQAWAKNIVGVGGFRHLNTLNRCDDYHGYTGSTGPAEDGRVKPDLAYFYDSIQSASGSSDTSYTSFGGTSSATPQTSGHAGLLFQMWHEGVWAGHGGGADVFDSRPHMATAKAMLVNHAYRYDWTNPGGCAYSDITRWVQGWGTADVGKLYDRASVTSIIDESDVIAPLGTKTYTATVQPGESELNVTMVYTDLMGTVGAEYNRINDLSLRVTSPSSTVYWGNNGLTAGNWSTSGGSSNTVDTVENVFIQNPQDGAWTIEVFGDEIVQDAHVETPEVDADFALVVSGGLLGTVTCTGDPDCDDGQWCNGAETCNLGTGQCEAGTPVVCDDGVACTDDTCNEGTDSCDYTPNDANCSNGLFCDGAETCHATLGCQAGTAPNCDDGIACTTDSCNEGTDQCDNIPDHGVCSNGLFCDGAEVCDLALGCQDGPDPCSGSQTCDEVNDVCEGGGDCTHGADFESGAGGWTNGADTCTTGFFVVGSPDATTWQVGGGNPGNAYYTQPNTGGLGTDDVDGGTCEALSPTVDCNGQPAAEISLDYFHGQRDAGDDSNDGFSIEVLSDGEVVDTMVLVGDVTHNAAWTNVSTVVVAPGDIQLRVRATDAAATGDIVEGGVDNVQISPTTVPTCVVDDDFEGGAPDWYNDAASTCTTGDYVTGNPTNPSGGYQIVGSHSGVTSIFTATNSSAGVNDVDGGNCILGSPTWAVPNASTLTVWYWHGQRDAGDDAAGDFFYLEYSINGGSSWTTLDSNGDSTSNPTWLQATAPIPAGSNVKLRVQCSDGAAAGDLVECGIDDFSICE